MLSLSNLQKSKGSTHRRKILGRGTGTGRGNYSTRGMKGQRARSGGKNKLALKGIKNYLLRIPKMRGFTSFKIRPVTVNINVLEATFKDNDLVSPEILWCLELIKDVKSGVKILGEGKLTKKLTVKASKFSKTAKNAILLNAKNGVFLCSTMGLS